MVLQSTGPKETAMRFINQYSFTLTAAAAVLTLAFFFLLRGGPRAADLIAAGAMALGLGLAYWLLQPGPSTLSSVEQMTAEIGAGKPVLLEFQSPY
jgi:lipopolysaccharide export LptBFGC system permease protein LptF